MKHVSEDAEIERIREALPRIVSPNLGCPLILSADNPQDTHAYLVLAERREEETPDWTAYQLRAEPSYPQEGMRFPLQIVLLGELHDDALPEFFSDVADTRLLISTTLRSNVFKDQARFWSFRLEPQAGVGHKHLRRVKGHPRSTLFDLVLLKGGQEVHRVKHALCLRVASSEVRFVHLTDFHVAHRNDMWAKEVNSILRAPLGSASLKFINFNERLRRFIKFANEQADKSELDLVLAMGDLVDFVYLGLGHPRPGENNWHVLQDILVEDEGLRVPIFTTVGNHDWRPYPYPPEFNGAIFGLAKKQAETLDYLYRDSFKTIGEKLASVHSKLVGEGPPILARSWWRSVVSFGLRGLELTLQRVTMRLLAVEAKELRRALLATGLRRVWYGAVIALLGYSGADDIGLVEKELDIMAVLPDSPWTMAAGILGVIVVWFLFRNWLGVKLRQTITSLIGVQTSVDGLRDYFLHFNPYFNYAFSVEKCYLLVVDTGHDCLTAQSFWDDGGKKVKSVSVRDNIIGGSPDTMGFFPPNQYFYYSQIAFLEIVLRCIQRMHNQEKDKPRNCRVFVGLHTPPANFSKEDRSRADRKLAAARDDQVLMPRRHWLLGGIDIRYGSINHYLSEFFYLCLGYTQAEPSEFKGPGIDAVFAGHAHWSIEFKLKRPDDVPLGESWKPQVYYGKFSQHVDQGEGPASRWWGPLLLQTAACGPPSQTDEYSPNYRYITVDAQLGVKNLSQRDARSLQ